MDGRPPLTPGTCGIVARIPLPSGTGQYSAAVTRQRGGFAFGPWSTGASAEEVHAWFMDDAAEGEHSLDARGGRNDLHWSVVLGTSTIIEIYRAGGVTGTVDELFNARTWADGDSTPTERGTILSAFWSGREAVLAVPALDGKAAVFAMWQAAAEPLAALLGPDGALVGTVRPLAPSDHSFGRCQAVTPTEHGGLVGFVDTTDNTLRLVELGGTASSIDVTYQLPGISPSCPVFSIDDEGSSFLLPERAEGSVWQLHRVDRQGAVGPVVATTRARAIALTTLPQGTLVLERDDTGPFLELLADAGSRIFPLEPTFPASRVFSGEPGRIFLDSSTAEAREIIELGCR